MDHHICPWWLGYTIDHKLRRLLHRPESICEKYVQKGMTVLDFGCGMGYFSIPLAHMVGRRGKVISVDIQDKMLEILMKRAKKQGVEKRIQEQRPVTMVTDQEMVVDFILSANVFHELPQQEPIIRIFKRILKDQGQFLLIEPIIHVSKKDFKQTVNKIENEGFMVVEFPRVAISRAAIFKLS